MNPQLLPICYLHAGICYPEKAGRRVTLSSHGDPQLFETGADGIRNAAHRAGAGAVPGSGRGVASPWVPPDIQPSILQQTVSGPDNHDRVVPPGMCYRDPVHGVRLIEVKGQKKGQPIRLTTNEWYKAQQLGDSFWLYVVWSPRDKPDTVPGMNQNPANALEHAAKPVVSARFWDIPAEAILVASRTDE